MLRIYWNSSIGTQVKCYIGMIQYRYRLYIYSDKSIYWNSYCFSGSWFSSLRELAFGTNFRLRVGLSSKIERVRVLSIGREVVEQLRTRACSSEWWIGEVKLPSSSCTTSTGKVLAPLLLLLGFDAFVIVSVDEAEGSFSLRSRSILPPQDVERINSEVSSREGAFLKVPFEPKGYGFDPWSRLNCLRSPRAVGFPFKSWWATCRRVLAFTLGLSPLSQMLYVCMYVMYIHSCTCICTYTYSTYICVWHLTYLFSWWKAPERLSTPSTTQKPVLLSCFCTIAGSLHCSWSHQRRWWAVGICKLVSSLNRGIWHYTRPSVHYWLLVQITEIGIAQSFTAAILEQM